MSIPIKFGWERKKNAQDKCTRQTAKIMLQNLFLSQETKAKSVLIVLKIPSMSELF